MSKFALLLHISLALAHSGLSSITFDGTKYPPFDSRIDNLIGPVRRIEWSHDITLTPFNPIADLNSPAVACQANAKAPALKAVARAGSDVTFEWTKIVKMHHGPAIVYMGRVPSPETKATDIKFFKIWERGFDASQNKWANEVAADNNNTYTAQVPSDIQSGTYVVRTELIALHANMKGLKVPAFGTEFYPYCFNVEIVGGGDAAPEGVTFPGAYKAMDAGIVFNPYWGNGTNDRDAAVAQDSKYVVPGPPLYQGKYEKPSGQAPEVKETGAYSGDLAVKYNALIAKLDSAEMEVVDFVNTRWPAPNTFDGFFGAIAKLNIARAKLYPEIYSFRSAAASAPKP